ncbi:MAG: GNAT family N-acetyltransferase [Methylovirgula sp.]|jgi:putative acetyltransferase
MRAGEAMNAQAFPKPALRPMLPQDAQILAEIFRDSVAELTGEDYDEAQQEAWIATADDEEAFAEKLGDELTLIATISGSPVAFISLKGQDQIDMLYVHPGVARTGVATLLLDAIEKLARSRAATHLAVDASDTARPFFEKRGFFALHRQTVPCGDEWLGNTHMEKPLEAEPERGMPR